MFYEQNKDRINAINSFLSDQLSKDTSKKLIYMRQNLYTLKDLPQYSYKDQYFVDGIIELKDEEVFVDCGAFTGDITERFIKKCPNYSRIICFEPDDRNFEVLKKNSKNWNNVEICKSGLYDINGHGGFRLDNTGMFSSITDSDNDRQISLVTIDGVEACHNATFIKMDIEGSEIKALVGAKETILRNHPKLAISIYQSDSDMLRIPEYVHSLVPEYNIYIRAHNIGVSEAILYAVDKK